MPLPLLLKYIYNNGTDEVIRRGKRIFATGGVDLVSNDPVLKTATFRVKSDTHHNTYRVTVLKYNEGDALSVRCQCPYNLGDICRHEAAALFQLQDLLDKNRLEEMDVEYDQRHTSVKMRHIDLNLLKLYTSQDIFEAAERMARHHQAAILKAANQTVEARLDYEGRSYDLVLQHNEDRNFDTQCPCDEHAHPLCAHKTALFLQLLDAYGPYYFDTLRNWDKEKNKLLSQYGYSLSDPLEGKFAFSYVNGKPFLRVLDPDIRKLQDVREPAPKEEILRESASGKRRLGVVFAHRPRQFPYVGLELVQAETSDDQQSFVSLITRLDLSRYIDYYSYGAEDRELIGPVRKLQQPELHKFLNRNSPFAGIWENIQQADGEEFPEETRDLILDYLHPKLQRLFVLLEDYPLVFWLARGKSLRNTHLQAIRVNPEPLRLAFEAAPAGTDFELRCFLVLGDERFRPQDNEAASPLLFLRQGQLHLMAEARDALELSPYLEDGCRRISRQDWPKVLANELLALSRRYPLSLDPSLVHERRDLRPREVLRLRETGDSLLLIPEFIYGEQEAAWDGGDTLYSQENGRLEVIHRDHAREAEFLEFIRSLHPSFEPDSLQRFYHLRSSEVLKDQWFFRLFDQLRQRGVVVAGFDTLKRFRFNGNRPETRLHIASGTDWFDAKVQLQFGDQQVRIRDIKKALANRQQHIELADGSLGLLPEEWMKKYSLLFRMGEETAQGLRLSKYNFAVIDELYEHLDDEKLRWELEEKKKRLLDQDRIHPVEVPTNLHAVLRNYQESGFQWLNYLDDISWGGILADDMGLGKTIQALSFLLHYKNSKGRCLALVVCPTTLIYNWENEIRKFTPDLSYHIHHGPQRSRKPEELASYNLIITTYGTLRSDVPFFSQLEFDYVVLDESQAIKNPQSKITKATQLLHTRGRICLSGTPMQNNTFDIYAQMQFLNPGMLGSIDFFRTEFAHPIDKFGEEDRKEQLRKLLYPFILRRTKEQVASDLPDKTETVLYCEMDPEQRHIYEAYRNSYRARILGSMDEVGLERSQLTILQGLMKLRQICDSPAILKEEHPFPNHSVKLHELSRELVENTGDHKVLVFSQFLGMLALIREKLQKQHIPFEYFDGSTSSPDREKAIRNFQDNERCRVFLISLKAGGVGLNLTAADYVYIVDPWWNPAVEQQAIDRTHRIGQTKNIFAYRMICKNTVEEKILELQERKRSLVKEIISDESGFIKKLSREDVLYLFS